MRCRLLVSDSAAPFSFRSGMNASSEQGRAIAAPSAASKSSSSLKKSPGALEKNEGHTRGAVATSRLPMVDAPLPDAASEAAHCAKDW